MRRVFISTLTALLLLTTISLNIVAEETVSVTFGANVSWKYVDEQTWATPNGQASVEVDRDIEIKYTLPQGHDTFFKWTVMGPMISDNFNQTNMEGNVLQFFVDPHDMKPNTRYSVAGVSYNSSQVTPHNIYMETVILEDDEVNIKSRTRDEFPSQVINGVVEANLFFMDKEGYEQDGVKEVYKKDNNEQLDINSSDRHPIGTKGYVVLGSDCDLVVAMYYRKKLGDDMARIESEVSGVEIKNSEGNIIVGAKVGDTITVSAPANTSGQVFSYWTGSCGFMEVRFTDPTSQTTSFVMPAKEKVILTPIYKNADVKTTKISLLSSLGSTPSRVYYRNGKTEVDYLGSDMIANNGELYKIDKVEVRYNNGTEDVVDDISDKVKVSNSVSINGYSHDTSAKYTLPNVNEVQFVSVYKKASSINDPITIGGIKTFKPVEGGLPLTDLADKKMILVPTAAPGKDAGLISSAAASEDSTKRVDIIESLDLNLVVTDNTDKKLGTITELNDEVSFSVNLDDDVVEEAGSEYKLVRVHNGVANVVEDVSIDETTGNITFKSDGFSTYAIVVYKTITPESNNPSYKPPVTGVE